MGAEKLWALHANGSITQGRALSGTCHDADVLGH
jgi:hypothetical protein